MYTYSCKYDKLKENILNVFKLAADVYFYL
jgi:hypothetical protein